MCLIIKSGSKISNASYENEIHRVDNEDSKNIIFFGQGGLISGEGPENLGNCQKQENLLLCKLGSSQL